MASLAEVSELIRKNDTKIIGNQDEQTDALQSIDANIRKFLAIQERSRLDDLEDKRERRRVTGTAAAAGAAAGSGGGGRGGGGPAVVPFGLNLGGLARGIGNVVAALTGLRLAQALSRSLSDAASRNMGTQRGTALDSNAILRNQLEDLKRNFKAERVELQNEIKRLRNDVANARAVENKLTRELDASKANARATLKTELEAASAKRAQLEAELKTARANLADAKADLADANQTLKDTKAASKLKTENLNNQVETLRARVAELSNNAAARAASSSRPAATSIPSANEMFQYRNAAGELKSATATGETFGPRVQATARGATFTVDSQNIIPGSLESRVLANTGSRVSKFNVATRYADIMNPVTQAETAAAVVSRLAKPGSGLAASSGALARTLGGPVIFGLTVALAPSNFTDKNGFASGMPSAMLASRIYDFLKAIQRNAPVAEILKFKKDIFMDGPVNNQLLMDALMAQPPDGMGLDEQSAADIALIVNASNPELGSILKAFYSDRNAKFAEGQAEFDRLNPTGVSPNKKVNEAARTKFALEYAGITGMAADRERDPGFINAAKNFFGGLPFVGMQNRAALSTEIVASQSKLARLGALESGSYPRVLAPNSGGSTVIGSVGDTNINNSNSQPLVIQQGGTDFGSSAEMNGSSSNQMSLQ